MFKRIGNCCLGLSYSSRATQSAWIDQIYGIIHREERFMYITQCMIPTSKEMFVAVGDVPYIRECSGEAQLSRLDATYYIESCEDLEGERARMPGSYLLKILRVCFLLVVQKIRDTPDNERFHLWIRPSRL